MTFAISTASSLFASSSVSATTVISSLMSETTPTSIPNGIESLPLFWETPPLPEQSKGLPRHVLIMNPVAVSLGTIGATVSFSRNVAAEEQKFTDNKHLWENTDSPTDYRILNQIDEHPIFFTGAVIFASALAMAGIWTLAKRIKIGFLKWQQQRRDTTGADHHDMRGHLEVPQTIDAQTFPTMDIRAVKARFALLGIEVTEAQIAAAFPLRPKTSETDDQFFLEPHWHPGQGQEVQTVGGVANHAGMVSINPPPQPVSIDEELLDSGWGIGSAQIHGVETVGHVSAGAWVPVDEIHPPEQLVPVEATPPTNFTPPETFPHEIGNYVLLEKLGEGGMSYVYLARHKEIRGLRFAVKLIAFNKLQTDIRQALDLFEREIKTMKDIDHPNVVQLRDFDLEHDPPYIVLEFVPGGNLLQWISNHYGRIAYPDYEKQALTIMMGILKGLIATNRAGVVHRDLKPENVFLAPHSSGIPVPKLGDFGIAKFSAQGNTLTHANIFRGTPYLIDPAHVTHALQDETFDVDIRSDIYTLGIMLYRLLTNRIPYPPSNEEPFHYLLKITRSDPIDPRKFNPHIPEAFMSICLKAMSKKREDRYQTPEEFMADLEAYLRNG